MHYFSKIKNGFYSDDVHSELPEDAVAITDELWLSLMEGQSQGRVIKVNSSGVPYLEDKPAPTKQQTIEAISVVIQQYLDNGAKAWGYDNIVSGCSYTNSTNAQYAADANTLIGWRDAVWEWANTKFEAVTPGTTPEEFMQGIPTQPDKPVVN